VETTASPGASQTRRRGFVWWVGAAAILIVLLVVAAFVWGQFTVWHVSNADRAAAVRAVAAAASAPTTRTACLRAGGAVTCLVETQSAGRCEQWSVQVRSGEVVDRPRQVSTTSC
jgi:hypothetical protein